jgi:hypothetical protein
MKHILNNISQEEKQTILEQHSGGKFIDTSSFKRLLESKLGDVKPLVMEQNPGAQAATPAFPTSGVEKDNNFPVSKDLLSNLKLGANTEGKTLKVSFNHDTGVSTAVLIFNSGYSGQQNKTWTQSFSCKCSTEFSSGVETEPIGPVKYEQFPTKNDTLGVIADPTFDKWQKDRCKAYVKRTNPKCNTTDYIHPSQPSDAEESLVSLFDAIESTSYNMEKNTTSYNDNLAKLESAKSQLKSLGFADKAAAQKKYDELLNIGMKNRTEEQDVEFDKLHNLLVNTLPGLERSVQAGVPSNAGNIEKVKTNKTNICTFINSGRHKKPGLERVVKAINGLLNDKNVYTTPPTGDLSTMTLDQKGALFCVN